MTGIRRVIFAGAAAVAGILMLSLPVQAQDLGQMQSQLLRLERDLADLKFFVHRGKPAPGSAQSGNTPAATPPSDAAGLDGKVAALEAEIRALTNRVEEINFTVRRLDDRLTRLVEDVDFRLTAIERNMGAGNGGAPAPASGNAPTGASQPQTLGTVSQEAVDRVNAGNPQPSQPEQPSSRPAQTAARTPSTAPAEALQGTPEQRYDVAFGLLQSKRFGEAEAAFEQFVADNPEHELAGNAQYWLGETYYVQGDYDRAASAFLEGYKSYRSSSKSPDNLLKLGITLTILNQKQDACAVFGELRDRYPNAQNSIKRRAKRESQKAGC